jgi:D-alanine-D-alanine ligase
MRVGLTYDLREDYLAKGYGEEETAEFDSLETVEALEEALRALGHDPVPIGNAHQLLERLSAGERWDLVFNIAEGLYGFGREALIPALLDSYQIPYTFSDPLVLTVTLHKATAKRIARDLGVPTADFLLVEEEGDLERIDLPYPLFLKPVAEGTGKGIGQGSRVESPAQLRLRALELMGRYKQPVLVETFLPGREYTVGVLGTGKGARVLGVMEVALRPEAEPHAYSYRNKEHCETLVDYRLVGGVKAMEAADLALRVWRGLGCRDAGRVDLREDGKGRLHFLEVNPLAGLNPRHSDLPLLCSMVGMSYLELIRGIMDSATSRLGKGRGE